jgi:soluble lytic murein transglycosylase
MTTQTPNHRWLLRLLVSAVVAATGPAFAQAEHRQVLDAREALRKKDGVKLTAALDAAGPHPLAQWIDYWELGNRLNSATAEQVEAFYSRWPGTYVEDRLRNDWLLELGKRRDWVNFKRDYPRFRMDDDREVSCYWLLTQHLDGNDVGDAARDAWFAQRDLDDGCNLMATTLYAAGKFSDPVVWQKARQSVLANRSSAARAALLLIAADASAEVGALMIDPLRTLKQRPEPLDAQTAELATLALLRLARAEPQATAAQLESRWERALPKQLAALVWAGAGQQAALELSSESVRYYRRARELLSGLSAARRALAPWSADMLAWQARSALRAIGPSDERWARVEQAVEALDAADQSDPVWVYWGARARLARAKAGPAGDADRQAARQQLESIAGPLDFYGKLAREDLGRAFVLPPAPAPLSEAERAAMARHPGLGRALLSLKIGLRSEGVREWNFSLRGMNDRELLAAAQLACDNEIWDRCINTSDRTRVEIDVAQRFPTPYRQEVLAQAGEADLDPALVYGLIRQESRFIDDIRSGAGASGLMQLMPATARWTAKKVGLPYQSSMINDRPVNLRLGSSYLKLLLDDFGGSQAMAAAGYNAGPGRPRRWREGPVLEPAAWAENIPFSETRDYVKKVLSNAVVYSALLGGRPTTLKQRLGPDVGPRDAAEPAANKALP